MVRAVIFFPKSQNIESVLAILDEFKTLDKCIILIGHTHHTLLSIQQNGENVLWNVTCVQANRGYVVSLHYVNLESLI